MSLKVAVDVPASQVSQVGSIFTCLRTGDETPTVASIIMIAVCSFMSLLDLGTKCGAGAPPMTLPPPYYSKLTASVHFAAAVYGFGRPKITTELPSGKFSWKLPPQATAMNCSPFHSKLIGAELQPAPALYCQSRLPVFESKALKLPLPSPVKVRPPAVESVPPIIGCGTFF